MSSDCKCGYLCLTHANSFYMHNSLFPFKKQKRLHINKHKCKECDSGFITLVKRVMLCEECNSPEFLETVQNKELCGECKNKK